jgi:hypothetical protein
VIVRVVAALALFLAAGCKTADAGQGGAKFLEGKVDAPRVSADAMYEICWEPHATGSVTLQFLKEGQIFFEAKDGASNTTGRCLREIAGSYPNAGAVGSSKEVKAPGHPASGWAWLAWAKLLSASRYGAERGILDAAPLVEACLSKGMGLRSGAVFEIEPLPSFEVRTLANDGRPGAFTDTEKCIDAVLGATAWPSSQPASFTFETKGGPAAEGDVDFYFHTGETQPALDAQVVHDAFALIQPAVGVCWEAALKRRPGLGGGRTVRLRVSATGAVEKATFVGNLSQSPRTASDYLLDQCLLGAVKAVRIPGPGETAYSWVFASR